MPAYTNLYLNLLTHLSLNPKPSSSFTRICISLTQKNLAHYCKYSMNLFDAATDPILSKSFQVPSESEVYCTSTSSTVNNALEPHANEKICQLPEPSLFLEIICSEGRDVATRSSRPVLTTTTVQSTHETIPDSTKDQSASEKPELCIGHTKDERAPPAINTVRRPCIVLQSSSSGSQRTSRCSSEGHHPSYKPESLSSLRRGIAKLSSPIKSPSKPEQRLALQISDSPSANFNRSEPGFEWFANDNVEQASHLDRACIRLPKSKQKIETKSLPKRNARIASATPLKRSDEDASADKQSNHTRAGSIEQALPLCSLLPELAQETNKSLDHRDGPLPPCLRNEKREKMVDEPLSQYVAVRDSSLAFPALTRINVHVVATVPSCYTNACAGRVLDDTATPMIQIVNSTSGCYKVIWDDIPSDLSVRPRPGSPREMSSATTSNSAAMRGLQQLQSEVRGRAEINHSSSELFKSQLMAFPDEDSKKTHATCHGDLIVSASVHLPCLSEGALPRRKMPKDNPVMGQKVSECMPKDQSLPRSVASQRPQRLRSARKLSNLEDLVRFRSHRDSVALARARLLHSDNVARTDKT